jgi:hypothetical protein
MSTPPRATSLHAGASNASVAGMGDWARERVGTKNKVAVSIRIVEFSEKGHNCKKQWSRIVTLLDVEVRVTTGMRQHTS